MTCKDCHKRMSDYLDGNLDETIKRDFDEHLKACSTCETQVRDIQSLQETLSHLRPIRPSSHFHFALRARVLQELARRRRFRRGFRSWVSYGRPVLIIAALAFLIAFSVRLSRHKPTEDVLPPDRIVTHYVLERISPSDRNASSFDNSDVKVHIIASDTLSPAVQSGSPQIRTVSF